MAETNDTNNTAADATAILSRLKELEERNVRNENELKEQKARHDKELQDKEHKIQALSADKRKQMEDIINNAISSWLNSLPQLSEHTKADFRNGIQKLASEADMNNAAWEVICCASQAHRESVERIESLTQEVQAKTEALSELKGFQMETARIGHKRPRPTDEQQPPWIPDTMQHQQGGTAWEQFANMISTESKSIYS